MERDELRFVCYDWKDNLDQISDFWWLLNYGLRQTYHKGVYAQRKEPDKKGSKVRIDVPILTLGIQRPKQKGFVIDAEPYCPSLYCNLSMSRVEADMLQDGNSGRRQPDYHLDVYDWSCLRLI